MFPGCDEYLCQTPIRYEWSVYKTRRFAVALELFLWTWENVMFQLHNLTSRLKQNSHKYVFFAFFEQFVQNIKKSLKKSIHADTFCDLMSFPLCHDLFCLPWSFVELRPSKIDVKNATATFSKNNYIEVLILPILTIALILSPELIPTWNYQCHACALTSHSHVFFLWSWICIWC